MISVIITAFKEPATIGPALRVVHAQLSSKDELIVIAPDMETLQVARTASRSAKNVRIVQDSGKGKPAALNLARNIARGNILVFTDGDVQVSENALQALITPFSDPSVGAVTGRPVSVNPRNTKMGYWAYALTETAHRIRSAYHARRKNYFASGYLFAIRKDLFPALSEQLLSEDGFISREVEKKGYRIVYAPEARILVKYPTTWNDWIKQKRRSAGGYSQNKRLQGKSYRSFWIEASGGWQLFRHVHSLRELIWLLELFAARVYLWFIIWKDIAFLKKKREELWQPVESTK